MSVFHDDNQIEEPIACNKLCDPVAEQSCQEAFGEDQIFTFCHVIDHKGLFKTEDSEHHGSCHNAKIEQEDAGVTTQEPFTIVGKWNPVTHTVCGKEQGSLNEPVWKQFKKHA